MDDECHAHYTRHRLKALRHTGYWRLLLSRSSLESLRLRLTNFGKRVPAGQGFRSALSGVRPHFVHDGCGRHGARLEVIENEKADCRGHIALLAIAVDLADQ